MSDELVILKIFNNEVDARMAQEVVQEAGVSAYVFKDDGGGMEPHLQRTIGVRLVVRRAQAERAHQILGPVLNAR
jgi:Putative prokaryotic signal transducing protein